MSLESVYTPLSPLFTSLGLDDITKCEAEPQKSSATNVTKKQLTDPIETDINTTPLDEILDTMWDISEVSPTLLATARADELLAPESGTAEPAEPAEANEAYGAASSYHLDIQRQMSTCSSTSSTGSLPQTRPSFGVHKSQYDDDTHSDMSRSARDAARRLHAFKELLDTEQRYVRDLGILIEIFLMPLSAITWITGEQKRAVIRNAWVIRGYHTTFLQQLESVIADIIDRLSLIPASNTNPSSVVQSPDNVGGTEKGLPTLPEHVTLGRIFLDHSNDFRSYVEYCSGHDKTLRVLVQLAENTKWRAFNEACKERLHSQKQETRLTIHDYLIKPVQRLCQYPIIMREIMSFYEEGTREHRDLRNAIDMLRNVATSVDDAKHMEEARQRTQLFLSRVDEISLSAFPDIAHYRNDGLLLAGALEFIDFNRGSKVCIKYYGCFVFPGLLLVARAQRAKTYRILHRFPLTDMLLIELSAAQSLLRYPWRLQCMKTKRNFDFGAAGPQERKLWFDLLARYTTQLRLRHRNDSTSSFESMASDLGLEQQSHLTDRYRNDTSGELYSGASDASLVETSSSRQSRSSAKSEDSTTSNTTLVPRIIRPNGLSRRYSHGNHDLHNAPTRKYTDVLSPVNEKSPDPPSPDQSLVRRILPLRRTQSVEFRSLHGSLTLPVESGTLRTTDMSGPPSPLRSQWSFRSSSGTDTTPARRVTIEQRFEDVFTRNHQTVHALEMRLQSVAEQNKQQRLSVENDTHDQATTRNNPSVMENDRHPAKRRVHSENVLANATANGQPPAVPVRTSSLRQTSSNRSIGESNNERPFFKIAHHSLSLTLSSARLITGAANRLMQPASTETTDDDECHNSSASNSYLDKKSSNLNESMGIVTQSMPSSPIMRPRSVNTRPKRINSLLFSSSLRINTDLTDTSTSNGMRQRSLSVQRSSPQLNFSRSRSNIGQSSLQANSSMNSPHNEVELDADKNAPAKQTAVSRLLRNTFRRARPQSTPPPSPSDASLRELASTPFASQSTLSPEPRAHPLMHHMTDERARDAKSIRRPHSAFSFSSVDSDDDTDCYRNPVNSPTSPKVTSSMTISTSITAATPPTITTPTITTTAPHSPIGVRHNNCPLASKNTPMTKTMIAVTTTIGNA